MTDLTALNELIKRKSNGFAEQKRFIANVLSGKLNNCPICHKTLHIEWQEEGDISIIKCQKKCTDIHLDVAN